jgi:ketosteroid isomerase-like protein
MPTLNLLPDPYSNPVSPLQLGLGLALLLLAGGLVACQPGGEPSSKGAIVDTAAVIGAVDSMRALFEKSANARDFKRLRGMMANGAVVVGPGGPEWNSLNEASEGPWPPGAKFELTPIETGVLGTEWAYDVAVTTVTYTPDGASEPRTLRHTGLVLFRKTEDGWKMYREVASPALPPDSLMER